MSTNENTERLDTGTPSPDPSNTPIEELVEDLDEDDDAADRIEQDRLSLVSETPAEQDTLNT